MSGFSEGADREQDERETMSGGEFTEELGDATGAADEDLGDGSDTLRPNGSGSGSRDTTVGDTAAADAEWEGRPASDATTGNASATSADAGFGDSAPKYASSDTEETLVPEEAQPETQGDDPIAAELGEEGQGDIAPEDL